VGTTVLLVLAIGGLVALLAYGLYGIDRIVRNRRADLAGTT